MQVHGMSPNIPSPKVRDMATPHISDMQKHTLPMGEKGGGKFLLNNNPDEVLANSVCKEPDSKCVVLCRLCCPLQLINSVIPV